MKERECSDPARTEKLSENYSWFNIAMFGVDFLYYFWFHFVFSCNYETKLTDELLSNIKSDQRSPFHHAEKDCLGKPQEALNR